MIVGISMTENVIIGANSYIARNFVYKLTNNYKCTSFKLYGKDDCQIDGFANYNKVNILDENDTNHIDLNCKYLYIFVGKTGSADGFENYIDSININQIALLNILNQYVKQKSQAKIVFLSTRLIYGNSFEPYKEDSVPVLKSIYAVNKYACEKYLDIYSKVFDVNYVVLRLCIPYGTLIAGASSYGTCGFMLKKAMNKENITIYGDGSQRRTFTYIGDVSDIIYNVAINDKCINDVYNIGGEDYSLNEVAKLIANKYNVNVDYIPFPEIENKIESGDTVFNSEKLDNIIGNLHKNKISNWINSIF